MPLTFYGVGSGTAITTGTGTVTKASCIEGQLLIVQLVIRGNSEDWSAFSNHVNLEDLAGAAADHTTIQTGIQFGATFTSSQALFAFRSIADGTCSADFAVGASGEDMFARMYEFQGASLGTTREDVFENDATHYNAVQGTGTSVEDCEVITNGAGRLALNFVALESNQAIGSFSGETGGNWTEAAAEFGSATGATATLQLQNASMATADTIDGGTVTVGVSTGWGSAGTAILPFIESTSIPAPWFTI